MLIAVTAKNQKVLSYDGEKTHKYFCPRCAQEVILKKGHIKIPHFAHKSSKNCERFNEAESYEHLKGKYLLAMNCKKFGLNYEIECYLPEIKQQPDLLIENKIAIEFQCSSLSHTRLRERTLSYEQAGYEVFWILGGKLSQSKTLTYLKKNFLKFNVYDSYYYISLDTDKSVLQVTRFIARVGHKNYEQTLTYSLVSMNCLDILYRRVAGNHYYLDYHYHKNDRQSSYNNWQKQLLYQNNHILKVQEFLYNRQLNLLDLPLIIYFPSIRHPFLKEWELVIRVVVLCHLEKQSPLSYEELLKLCCEEVASVMDIFYLQLEANQIVDYCVSLYLNYLKRIGVVIEKKGLIGMSLDVLADKDIENFHKNQVEFLSLPLKYDMIAK